MTPTHAIVLEALITEATREAYENVAHWMNSDSDIAGQLRNGLADAREAFDTIDARERTIPDLLHFMRRKATEVLARYQNLPADQGQWECSALNRVVGDIDRLITHHYEPDEAAIAAAAARLERDAQRQRARLRREYPELFEDSDAK